MLSGCYLEIYGIQRDSRKSLDTAFKIGTRYRSGGKAVWVSFSEGGVVIDRLQFPDSDNLRMNYVIRMSTLHLPYRFQPK